MSPLLEQGKVDGVQVDIRLAVSEIAALKQETALRFALTVGEIVVRRIFHGDIKKLRRRGPKDVAICRLAEHPDLPISVRSLYVAVQVYEMVDRLGDLSSWRDLYLSHFKTVLALPQQRQRELLTRAANEMWSVIRLRREIESEATREPEDRSDSAQRAYYSRRLRSIVRHANLLQRADAAEVAASLDREELERVAAGASRLAEFTAQCLALRASRDGSAARAHLDTRRD